jgi:Tfp pilus assembly protein PilF
MAAQASRADAQSRPARAASAPTPAEAAVAEGIALLQQNRPSDARARFEHALTLDPRSPDAHYMLGWLREQARDFAGAAAEYESALASAPTRAAIRDRLGFVQGELGDTARAIAEFRQAVRLDPSCSTRAITWERRSGGRAMRRARYPS